MQPLVDLFQVDVAYPGVLLVDHLHDHALQTVVQNDLVLHGVAGVVNLLLLRWRQTTLFELFCDNVERFQAILDLHEHGVALERLALKHRFVDPVQLGANDSVGIEHVEGRELLRLLCNLVLDRLEGVSRLVGCRIQLGRS